MLLFGCILAVLSNVNNINTPLYSNLFISPCALCSLVTHLQIKGIDLSGDPSKGEPANFLPALARARTLGLKLAVHLAELDRPEDTDALLASR